MLLADSELRAWQEEVLREIEAGCTSNLFHLELIQRLIETARAGAARDSYIDGRTPRHHIDRALYDFKLPDFVRSFIAIKSLNATCTLAIEGAGDMPKLYGKFEGRHCRVTLLSNLGDVGISYTDREHGYDRRGLTIYDVTDYTTAKPDQMC